LWLASRNFLTQLAMDRRAWVQVVAAGGLPDFPVPAAVGVFPRSVDDAVAVTGIGDDQRGVVGPFSGVFMSWRFSICRLA